MTVQSVLASRHVVATADHRASRAAVAAFTRGGNAVDAAIAANAAIAVTSPHLCGLGGDLFALVHTPAGEVIGLNASGRAGSRSDAAVLRAAGHPRMPMRHDVRTVTAPGCVDGWQALHERFGRLGLREILAPAIELAEQGFRAGPLADALGSLDAAGRAALPELADQANRPAARVRRPGVARTLRGIAEHGREAFYAGEFAAGLVALDGSPFTAADLRASHADWVDTLSHDVFGSRVHTLGPNSQGYLVLAIAGLAERLGLPDDPTDPAWAHLLIEAAKVASSDRHEVLYDGADGSWLLSRALARGAMVHPARATPTAAPTADGDTTYLCAADAEGWAVSLIQSNAAGFGAYLVEPGTGINLHNRGLGFSLIPGHPAELAPGRRPPHTLAPAMVMRADRLYGVLGTMGGDAQPQIVAQLLARLLHNGQDVTEAVLAPRWVLRGPTGGFGTWHGDPPTVVVEDGAPDEWLGELRRLGHRVARGPALSGEFGHAQAITVDTDDTFAAAADPRAVGSAAAGH
ncbi:gamma-glutamyltransferase family protein [Nocardioides limicola]|uniref:gamma-glutamyltransferase family protein n=1 Tax=Nocardioides limicola TaxID=2803368 RepID=UPI00193AFBA2|nr:gamma-glutamyltransferase [Nocardioides sp. DJM-14]